MTHLVQFSTGLSSAEVAWRLVAEHGAGAVVLMTADTLREDPDNWRFAREVVNRLSCEWIKLTDGRTPMEVGRDHKCVPSNRMAVCSRVLKRELLRCYLDANYDPAADAVYIGYDWSEPHRIASAQRFWEPWAVHAPLAEPPYAPPLQPLFRSRGIEPPDLYRYGYSHANCGGCCVRAGQAPWAITLQVHPERYREWEAEEEKTRQLLGKDVAILRDRRGGTVTPLTLRTFRERKEAAATLFDTPGLPAPDDWYDKDDIGACGCDMDGDSAPAELYAQAPGQERSMSGLLDAIVSVVIVFALAYGSVAGVIVLAVMAPKVWKRVTRRRAFPKAALQRNWPRLPQRWRIRRVPCRNPDGRPLTVPERERMAWIEDGYARTAAEPGRQR